MQKSEGKMDTTNKLHTLQQDILDFGDVINHTKNPGNMDFINACDLFSQHINHQLKNITSSLCMKDIRSEMQETTSQLYALNELITPTKVDDYSGTQWPEKLLHFCKQLQSLKNTAA